MTHKRGNGSGTARKRGTTWTAIWTIGTVLEDGKVRQVRRTKGGFRTKTEALAFAAQPTADSNGQAPSLYSYWETWKNNELPKLSKSKQTAYKIAKAKMEAIMFRPIDKLTIKELQAEVDIKATTYYTAKDCKTLLSHLYRMGMAEEWIHTNLADFINLPPLDEKELQPFSEIELHKLWDNYGKGEYFVGFILLMIYTGMMPGELFQLKKDMVNWDTYEIKGCGLKTKKRKETPIVFPEVIAPLLLDLCQQSQSRVGNVLCMNRDNFYTRYHDTLKLAGVRDLPPYSCRHTTATALALGNIAPSVIQEVMRHTKFSTTQRYIHPDMASAHYAINSLDKGKAIK